MLLLAIESTESTISNDLNFHGIVDVNGQQAFPITHFDADWNSDAPGFKPLSSTSDNSSYPLIPMDGSAKDGELTLHMEDYQDVLRVETTGWNESIHLVDVVVEGDVYDLQVSILNMDQETWDVLDEITATYSMDKIRVTLDVGLELTSSKYNTKMEHLHWTKMRLPYSGRFE